MLVVLLIYFSCIPTLDLIFWQISKFLENSFGLKFICLVAKCILVKKLLSLKINFLENLKFIKRQGLLYLSIWRNTFVCEVIPHFFKTNSRWSKRRSRIILILFHTHIKRFFLNCVRKLWHWSLFCFYLERRLYSFMVRIPFRLMS